MDVTVKLVFENCNAGQTIRVMIPEGFCPSSSGAKSLFGKQIKPIGGKGYIYQFDVPPLGVFVVEVGSVQQSARKAMVFRAYSSMSFTDTQTFANLTIKSTRSKMLASFENGVPDRKQLDMWLQNADLIKYKTDVTRGMTVAWYKAGCYLVSEMIIPTVNEPINVNPDINHIPMVSVQTKLTDLPELPTKNLRWANEVSGILFVSPKDGTDIKEKMLFLDILAQFANRLRGQKWVDILKEQAERLRVMATVLDVVANIANGVKNNPPLPDEEEVDEKLVYNQIAKVVESIPWVTQQPWAKQVKYAKDVYAGTTDYQEITYSDFDVT